MLSIIHLSLVYKKEEALSSMILSFCKLQADWKITDSLAGFQSRLFFWDDIHQLVLTASINEYFTIRYALFQKNENFNIGHYELQYLKYFGGRIFKIHCWFIRKQKNSSLTSYGKLPDIAIWQKCMHRSCTVTGKQKQQSKQNLWNSWAT